MTDQVINYVDVMTTRGKRLLKMRENPENLSVFKMVYKNDPVLFINDWFFTYNPQCYPAVIPFILFPRQEELINFFHERNLKREDGLCEKCRNVGFTWLAIAYAVWLWLFFPDQKISFGSRKQDYVDKIGDPDSIFEKIRFSLRNLPRDFLPIDFDINSDAPFMRIMNRENTSIITGEAGDNIGRGGRSTLYFLDEAAFLEHPQKVEAAISENSDCKIYISTPNGVGNIFHQKRFSGKVPVFTFHWYDDPRKDKEWYDKKKDTLDAVIFAQEIEIDYGASIENVCIPALWVKAALSFSPDGIETGELVAGLDVADEGGDLNSFTVRQGSRVQSVTKTWAEGNTTQTARKARNYCLDLGIPVLCYDSIGVGAGVKGELTELEKELAEFQMPNTNKKTWPFKAVGINVALQPTKGFYVEGKKNENTFLNLKAQLWWLMRRRFEKTFEHVTGVKEYPLDELISLPNDNDLIVELSQPRFFFTSNGKIQIESKKSMKERGLRSPNKADSLMLAFSPYRDLVRDPKIRIL